MQEAQGHRPRRDGRPPPARGGPDHPDRLADDAAARASGRTGGDAGCRVLGRAAEHGALVQQLLDAVGGRHVFLLPQHDQEGGVTDFVIAAASPAIVDLSGRDRQDLIGGRLSQLYPWLPDTPLWPAWTEALTLRRDCTVGPFSYPPRTCDGVVSVTLTAWARPVGQGLLASWTRGGENDRLVERLRQMERLDSLASVRAQLDEHKQRLAAEHRLAGRLQDILLPVPAEPVDLPGLRVAVRYRPAEPDSRVGGDWFHLAATGDGAVLLAIGDVAGRGVQAAATMAQLRYALAALVVTTTTEPAELLAHLNRLLYAGGVSAPTATVAIARYAPATGDLVWAQAGHPAPLCSRAGVTTQLARPAGPLLGAIRDARYGTATVTLSPADVLVLYTDGLIERRGRTLAEGVVPVVATLDRITAQPRPRPLADLLGELHQANPHDDTCILAARRIPPAP